MTQKSALIKKMSLVGIVTILFGLTAFPVGASSRYYPEDVYHFGNREGYSMGFRRGKEDYANRVRYNYSSDSAYKHADYGYRDDYGHKGDYKRGFKDGFAKGYDDAFYSCGYHEPRGRNVYDERNQRYPGRY